MIEDDSKLAHDSPAPDAAVAPDKSLVTAVAGPVTASIRTQQRLDEVLAQLPAAPDWQLDHLAARWLRLQGDGECCRLQLRLTAYLQAPADQHHAQLELDLVSATWQPTRALPALVVAEQRLPPAPAQPADSLLSFSLERVEAGPEADARSGAWLRYLAPPGHDAAVAGLPLAQRLEAAVEHWLSNTAALQTLAGAEAAAFHGPLGHFGPLEAQVLERSGQLDLEVDATLLATADDAPEAGGEPAVTLALYGERFGVWLLHRRTAKVVRAARKGVPALRQWSSELLQADTVQALMQRTGLGEVEKRLYRAAGVLPNATLWSELAGKPAAGATPVTTIDLASVPDTHCRYLQAIVAFAQQGQLDTTDLDLLHRTARQLVRAKTRRR